MEVKDRKVFERLLSLTDALAGISEVMMIRMKGRGEDGGTGERDVTRKGEKEGEEVERTVTLDLNL